MTEEIDFNFTKSTADFMNEIEQVAINKKCSYLDAVLIYCEQNGVEIETAASIIKSSAKLKARIHTDAEELNYFPKTRKLPI